MNAIFAPLPTLPAHLEQFRFWIWLQFVALRIYVLALTGKKCRFLMDVDRWGNVRLIAIGDAVGEAPKRDPFAFEPSAAYKAALGDGEPTVPLSRRHPCRRVSMVGSILPSLRVFHAMDARLRGHLRKYEASVPIPDT